jgi:Sulfatase
MRPLATALSASALAGLMLAANAGAAQDAPAGSPAATAPIEPLRIPNPPAAFHGVINLDAASSMPYWAPQVSAPAGAPNILMVIIDDEGFGAPSTFGGVIPTPELDRLASDGLRYTQFHTTSLCSPTRAALITGRNHHSVGSARPRPAIPATTASSLTTKPPLARS